MDLDLDQFAAAVNARTTRWHSAGVHWTLHHGPTGAVTSVHYEMSGLDDLATCLDDLTHGLTSLPSGT
jgi:hypothetical protein